jgi:glycosyltransferase involved in cell wall biosynthesis
MSTDPQPAKVEPVPSGATRPLWSVMVPTYNCAKYLRQTLESVLAQDPGPDQMQIEVVDDCSTKDDPQAVARDAGRGRVAFYRKPGNAGATANFNTCVERSRGSLVHILHGDDYVAGGFYEAMAKAALELPDCGLFASRCFIVDEDGVIAGVTQRLPALEKGGRVASSFYYENPIQCAGVVVRRSVYERLGGFLPSLAHTADCEMWSRAVAEAGGFVSTQVLAFYRAFPGNDTGRLARTADNLRDIQRLGEVMRRRHEDMDLSTVLATTCRLALAQAKKFRALGDVQAAEANLKYWREHATFRLKLVKVLRSLEQPFRR